LITAGTGYASSAFHAKAVSGRDVSSTTAPVARSSPMRAPEARHRQLAQIPTDRSDGCCRPRRRLPGHPGGPSP
jgi:hypothetical protein